VRFSRTAADHLTPDPRLPSVFGRCETCAARRPGYRPPVLVVAMEGEGPAIWPVVRHSRETATRAEGGAPPHEDPDTTAHWSAPTRRQLAHVPLQRGERLNIRCPGCKREHDVKASTVLALADQAAKERSGEFLLP